MTTPAPRTIDRVIASYNGVPCTTLRPIDAPVRPGESCGEIHGCCRGHSTGSAHPERRGDPCQRPALSGLEVCGNHGGQLPEPAAKSRQVRAQRAVGRLTGDSTPVIDPAATLAELAGEIQTWRDGLRELVAKIQDGDDDLTITAGAEWYEGDDARRHPNVTGDLLVLDPAGHYKVHPLVTMAEAADERLAKVLAEMTKLGIADRLAKLQEDQVELAVAAVKLMLERMGHNPDDGLGLFLAAARDVNALSGTVSQAIEAHVVHADDDVWP